MSSVTILKYYIFDHLFTFSLAFYIIEMARKSRRYMRNLPVLPPPQMALITNGE